MKDKLQMWSLIVGMGMIGPVALGASINKLFTGEIRINRRVFVSAIDNPVLFHVFAIALIIGSLVATRCMAALQTLERGFFAVLNTPTCKNHPDRISKTRSG